MVHARSCRRAITTIAAGALITLGVAACGGGDNKSSSGTNSSGGAATQPAGKKIKVGLVTDIGGLNDKSFNHLAFVGLQLAEKEGIKVSQEEVAQRIQQMAATYQVPPDKFVKDLQQRNGIVEIYDQVASEKTLEFLQQNAKIEDMAPEAPKPA